MHWKFSFVGRNLSKNFYVNLYTKYLRSLWNFLLKICFYVFEWYLLISLYLVQYKYAEIRFEKFPPIGRKVPENFCVSL